MLHRLHHDDGVVNHQTDGQHQTEQGQGVDGETEQGEKGKGTHQRHRHRQEWDEGGPPPLEEDENHDHHQQERLQQGNNYLAHTLGNSQGGIQGDDVVQVGRKALLQLGHELLGAVGRQQGIGARHLVEGDGRARLAVQARVEVVGLGPQLNPGHIPDPDDGSVLVGAQHDGAELLLCLETSLGAHRIGELLAPGRRFRAHLSGRIHRILGIDCIQDLGNGDVQLGKLVRFYPDAHGVLSSAEDGDTGDTGDTRHLIIDVDIGVIGQEDVIVCAFGGVEGDEEQRGGSGLLHRDPVVAHVRRQLRLRLSRAHLGQQLVGVTARLQAEVDRQPHPVVTGVCGVHAVHVLHDRYLLLYGGGDGLFQGQGVSAGIGGVHLDLRRDDIRKLRDRQTGKGHKADDHHEYGDDDGHDGSIDKEP